MVVIEVNVLIAGNNSSMAIIQKLLDAIAKDAFKFVYKSLSNEKVVGLGRYQIGFILVDNKNAKTHIMEITGEILRVCDFVVIVGINQEDVIIKLIEDGAFECLRTPIEQSALLSCLWRLIRIVRLHTNNNTLKDRCIDSNIRLVGSSHSIRYLKAIIEKTANSSSRVMITGASGAGKKLVARLIHKSSCNQQGEFVVCRSADYKSENFCCKTFNVDYPGNIFRKTAGGVLYIEECTLLPLEAQAQLLNFIHNDQFGSDRNNGQKPRIIASSSMDIEEALNKGLLREDLYYRLRVIPIRVPPLVERVEDFAELCQHFVDHFSKIEDLPHKELDPTVIAMMQTYHWPYNVSQLKNIVEWLLISTKNNPNSTIGPEAFSPSANIDIINTMPDVVSMSIKDAREAFEKKYLQAQISRFGGNISKTARFVRMERSALHRKLKALNMCS